MSFTEKLKQYFQPDDVDVQTANGFPIYDPQTEFPPIKTPDLNKKVNQLILSLVEHTNADLKKIDQQQLTDDTQAKTATYLMAIDRLNDLKQLYQQPYPIKVLDAVIDYYINQYLARTFDLAVLIEHVHHHQDQSQPLANQIQELHDQKLPEIAKQISDSFPPTVQTHFKACLVKAMNQVNFDQWYQWAASYQLGKQLNQQFLAQINNQTMAFNRLNQINDITSLINATSLAIDLVGIQFQGQDVNQNILQSSLYEISQNRSSILTNALNDYRQEVDFKDPFLDGGTVIDTEQLKATKEKLVATNGILFPRRQVLNQIEQQRLINPKVLLFNHKVYSLNEFTTADRIHTICDHYQFQSDYNRQNLKQPTYWQNNVFDNPCPYFKLKTQNL